MHHVSKQKCFILKKIYRSTVPLEIAVISVGFVERSSKKTRRVQRVHILKERRALNKMKR